MISSKFLFIYIYFVIIKVPLEVTDLKLINFFFYKQLKQTIMALLTTYVICMQSIYNSSLYILSSHKNYLYKKPRTIEAP